MEDFKRLAAIDIGSNAVRLLINNVLVDEEVYFKKANLIRVPVRLGEDVFTKGDISEYNSERLIKAMHAFRNLLEVFNVEAYMALATSAMREAGNGQQLVDRIARETEIDIRIIDGKEEADILYSTQISGVLNPQHQYLFVDVGGGSTETTFFDGAEKAFSRSWKIGTVRLLRDQTDVSEWQEMAEWLKEKMKVFDKHVRIIGSGGNINRIFKMSRNKVGRPITESYLRSLHKLILSYSIRQRMTILDLNPDRADVIEPALRIFLFIMEHTRCSQVLVPKIGLSDGIIRKVYERYLHQHTL